MAQYLAREVDKCFPLYVLVVVWTLSLLVRSQPTFIVCTIRRD